VIPGPFGTKDFELIRTAWVLRAPREPEPGQEHERACPDEHGLDDECGVQPEVVGEAAEEVGGSDDEHAAEELDTGVRGVAVSGRGGQGEGQ
jgi:hypothetical protein